MTTELAGLDLARQALLAAREAAKKNGATRQKLSADVRLDRPGRRPDREGEAAR
ncbi:hypothetical protein [Streptomyces sp. NPDC092903]|uniref:hypothetical protein n=1 Tax=Streptomyces sp. NPDC092903 TaxID=3366017 RepID=UPI0037FEB420